MKVGLIHETLQREEEVVGSSNRAFGALFTAVLFLAAAYLLWQGSGRWVYWAASALILAVLTAVVPIALEPFNRLWMRLGLLLHKLTTPVALAVLFFGTALPTGIVMRLLGKDPLRLTWDEEAPSYWIPRTPPGPRPESLKRQF
jgi:hypothetical protein